MNKGAIIVYVDDNEKIIAEFGWLWKSWLMWDINEEWDLVAFVNPSAMEKVKAKYSHDNVVFIEKEPMNKPGTTWEGYGFVNSFAMFTEKKHEDILRKYDYGLRTDCDTFLTKNFKGFDIYGSRVYVGNSSVLTPQDQDFGSGIIDKLKIVSKSLKLRYNYINHVGASIMTSMDKLIGITKLHYIATQFILKWGWAPGDKGHWPGWFKGVASMYGIHVAVNHYTNWLEINSGSLDVWCQGNTISSSDLHIHAWQFDENGDIFNKLLWHKGELPKIKYGKIPKTAGEYCLLVANEDLDYLRMCVAKEG